MGMLSPVHWLLLGVIALLVFGPKRLPEIGRQVGAALRELRKLSRDLMSQFEEHNLLSSLDDDVPARVRSVDRTAYGTHPSEPPPAPPRAAQAPQERTEEHAA